MQDKLKTGLIVGLGFYCAASLIVTFLMLMDFTGISVEQRGQVFIPFETRQSLAPLAGIGFLTFWYWLCSQKPETQDSRSNHD